MSRSGTVATWRDQLAELSVVGDALRTAIVAGDVVAAIAAAVRVRQVRAELAPADDGGALPDTRASLAALADATALIGPARTAEAVLDRWLARPLAGDAVLLGSPRGVAVLAESMLPPVWDLARDLVVLVGDSLAPVATLLADLGQRRIVQFAADRPVAELSVAIRAMQPCPPGRLVVRAELGVEHDIVAEIARIAENAISDLRIQRNTVTRFSQTWVEQGLANLPALARWPSIAAVGTHLRGLPLAIVAPGPSLARNAHVLAALRGRAVIAAFSHSLRPVLAAGVVPDLVISVDPQDLRYHFAGCDVSASHLVNAATVHPSLFELGARGYFGVASNAQLDDWVYEGLGDAATASGGGSVATTALSLALRWGCDPVIFVGLDLSFSDDGYYVSTSVDGSARARVTDGVVSVDGWSPGFHAMRSSAGAAPGERVVELPGWNGGTVRSSFMFSMFRRWFIDRLDRDAGLPTVYNCTEGGAFVDGMVHRPLAEVVATLPASGVDGAAILDAVVAATDATARRERLAHHLDAQIRAIHRCRALARRARRFAATADPRLTAVEARLAEKLRPLRVASLLAQRELEHANDLAMRPATAERYLAESHRVFGTLLDVLDRLEPGLRTARAELGGRHVRAA